jgi:hypothetical protein
MCSVLNAAMLAIGSLEAKPVTAAHMPGDQNRPESVFLRAAAIGQGISVSVELANVAGRIGPVVVMDGGVGAWESQPERGRRNEEDRGSRHLAYL